MTICKKLRSAAVLLGGMALAAYPAMADGMPRSSLKDVPAAAPFSWTGFYVGGHASYSWTDTDWKLNYPFGGPGNGPQDIATSYSANKLVPGIHLGYQHQFGNFVIGAEVARTNGFRSQTAENVNLFAGIPVGTLTTDVDWLLTATARIGYAWDRWLGYIKGGYARSRIGLSANDRVPAPFFGFDTARNTYHGWTVGAGAEYAVSNSIVIGLEYDYVDLGRSLSTDVVTLTNPPVDLGVDARSRVDTSVHSIMGRLSVKLNPF